MRRVLSAALIAASLVLLASCGGAGSEYTEDTVFAMNTLVTYRVCADNAEELITRCEQTVSELEASLSRTVEDSSVSAFNASEQSCELDGTAAEVVAGALRLSRATGGLYDPSVAPLVDLWDITGDSPRVPADSEITEALAHVGCGGLTLDGTLLAKTDPAMKLDLGGAGKGYACGRAVQILAESGGYGIVSFGSSIGVFGAKPDGSAWNIAITDPADTSSTVGYVGIDSGFISVSGDYERYAEIDGRRYCHIIDPRSGRPVDNGVHSAVVWTSDAETGDALSTALMVSGEDGIERFRAEGLEFEALLITDGGNIMTDGMKKIITFNESTK